MADQRITIRRLNQEICHLQDLLAEAKGQTDAGHQAYEGLLKSSALAVAVAEAATAWHRGEIDSSALESKLSVLLGRGSPKHPTCPDCPIP